MSPAARVAGRACARSPARRQSNGPLPTPRARLTASAWKTTWRSRYSKFSDRPARPGAGTCVAMMTGSARAGLLGTHSCDCCGPLGQTDEGRSPQKRTRVCKRKDGPELGGGAGPAAQHTLHQRINCPLKAAGPPPPAAQRTFHPASRERVASLRTAYGSATEYTPSMARWRTESRGRCVGTANRCRALRARTGESVRRWTAKRPCKPCVRELNADESHPGSRLRRPRSPVCGWSGSGSPAGTHLVQERSEPEKRVRNERFDLKAPPVEKRRLQTCVRGAGTAHAPL